MDNMSKKEGWVEGWEGRVFSSDVFPIHISVRGRTYQQCLRDNRKKENKMKYYIITDQDDAPKKKLVGLSGAVQVIRIAMTGDSGWLCIGIRFCRAATVATALRRDGNCAIEHGGGAK